MRPRCTREIDGIGRGDPNLRRSQKVFLLIVFRDTRGFVEVFLSSLQAWRPLQPVECHTIPAIPASTKIESLLRCQRECDREALSPRVAPLQNEVCTKVFGVTKCPTNSAPDISQSFFLALFLGGQKKSLSIVSGYFIFHLAMQKYACEAKITLNMSIYCLF